MLIACEGNCSCWGVDQPSVSDDFGLRTCGHGVASAGQLVSGLMDSKPQMPLVLSRTQSLLG